MLLKAIHYSTFTTYKKYLPGLNIYGHFLESFRHPDALLHMRGRVSQKVFVGVWGGEE